MQKEYTPHQFEFIIDYSQNVKAELKGNELSGDIDFMYGRLIDLFHIDPDLKTIFKVNTSLVTVDTTGNTVEAENETIMNIYKYEHQFNVDDLYGLFCYATIMNYKAITQAICDNNITHNGVLYKPTVVIPTLEAIKNDLLSEIEKASGK